MRSRAQPSTSPASEPAGIATLRLGTWNLRHDRDLGAVAAGIAAAGVDVVALQEVDRLLARSGHVDQAAELARRLGWSGLFAPTILGFPDATGHAGAVSGAADDDRPAYGVGLLSRLPLGVAASVRLPAGRHPILDAEPRVLLRAPVSTTAGEIDIWVTHLSWVPWRAWDQLRAVLRSAGGHRGAAIIAGDLNLPAPSVGAATAGTPWRTATTARTFPARLPCVQLDHILVRDARITNVRVDASGASDHRMLSATVQACAYTLTVCASLRRCGTGSAR